MAVFRLTDYSQVTREEDLNEVLISTDQELRKVLLQFQQHDPGFIDLLSPGNDCLSIGIGGSFACLMFIDSSGDPPYLWANGNTKNNESVIEFYRGGTPVPVPLSRCLPFQDALEIIIYYFLHEQLPDTVEWEED